MDRESILKTEYSKKFDELMSSKIQEEIDPHFNELRKNMMIMSYYKYGAIRDNYEKHKCMDALGNIQKRLQKYKETGNTEFLADIANFAMIEYMYSTVKKTVSLQERESILKNRQQRTNNFDSDIQLGLDIYTQLGDIFGLVAIAAIAAIEFTYPTLANAHYTPTDSGACETVGFGIKQMYDEMEEENKAYNRFI